MRVFVVGASGYIGSAVVAALVAAGHEATGLARSPEAERRVRSSGGRPAPGDLRTPEGFARQAAEHDAVVHVGFHRGPEGVASDRKVVEASLAALAATGRPRAFVYTSGVMVLGSTGGRVANEDFPTAGAAQAVAWRPAHEQLALQGGSPTLAVSVVRPGMVFGGKGGHTGTFFASCEKEGVAVYLGDGQNRWPMVHLSDIAQLYRLLVEKRARGIFHGVDGVPIRVVDLARACSEAAGKGGKTRSLPIEEARKQRGAFADAMCLDQRVGAPRALELGWTPRFPPLPGSAPQVYREWKA